MPDVFWLVTGLHTKTMSMCSMNQKNICLSELLYFSFYVILFCFSGMQLMRMQYSALERGQMWGLRITSWLIIGTLFMATTPPELSYWLLHTDEEKRLVHFVVSFWLFISLGRTGLICSCLGCVVNFDTVKGESPVTWSAHVNLNPGKVKFYYKISLFLP